MAQLRLTLALCATAVLLTLVPPAEARLRSCSPITVAGQRVPVRAQHFPCTRARKMARSFVRHRWRWDGWTSTNPAGCEHVLYRKRDRAKVEAAMARGTLPSDVAIVATSDPLRCIS